MFTRAVPHQPTTCTTATSTCSGDEGNSIMLSLSWKLSRGRKYKDIKRTMNNHDRQTGTL